MKAKQIIGILAVLTVCSILPVSQGAEKFYYGTYRGRPESDFDAIKDSLKFNIVVGDVNEDTIDYYVEKSLRAIVVNRWDPLYSSPSRWATTSHYTLWEAEGLDGSYYKLSSDGGTLVDDPSASGGKARKFSGPQTPRIIQWGPTYAQELGPVREPIKYTAEFCLKSYYAIPEPPGIEGVNPPTPVCSIMVVETVSDSILKANTLLESDFAEGVYKIFKLEGYTVPDNNRIEFQIYLFGIDENEYFYVDYVKVYDQSAWRLIDDPDHTVANNIRAYVDQEWTKTVNTEGDTVIYRWYLRDEPAHIDLFEPSRYIDSLLREVSAERVGFQAFWKNYDDTLVHEYFLRQNPEEYHVDIYPTGWWGPDSSGEEFQQGVGQLTHWLNVSKNVADSLNKDFWVSIQTHFYGREIDNCESCGSYCMEFEDRSYCGITGRLPTPNEVRLQTFLALCYGANSILHFCYYSRNDSGAVPEAWDLMLGLWDTLTADGPTPRWYEIKNFTGPRVEVLGPVFNQLTWQGACPHSSVGSFVLRNANSSYIDSITGTHPGSTSVEVGFFVGYEYEDYFMLVNRRCLEGHDEVLNVYFNMSDGPYYVTDMFTPEFPDGKIRGANPYTIALEPGEGRLFKLEKFY